MHLRNIQSRKLKPIESPQDGNNNYNNSIVTHSTMQVESRNKENHIEDSDDTDSDSDEDNSSSSEDSSSDLNDASEIDSNIIT